MTHVICHVSDVRCQVSGVTCHVSHVTSNFQTRRARELKFERRFTSSHLSLVICHVSCVTCHMSQVMCQVSHFIYIFFYFFWTKWRSYVVEGRPRLVFTINGNNRDQKLTTCHWTSFGSSVSFLFVFQPVLGMWPLFSSKITPLRLPPYKIQKIK